MKNYLIAIIVLLSLILLVLVSPGLVILFHNSNTEVLGFLIGLLFVGGFVGLLIYDHIKKTFKLNK